MSANEAALREDLQRERDRADRREKELLERIFERDVALTAAGAALAPFAAIASDVAGFPSGEDQFECFVLVSDARQAAAALSAPALSRAVALDRARREECAESTALLRYCLEGPGVAFATHAGTMLAKAAMAASERRRALEAEPAEPAQ